MKTAMLLAVIAALALVIVAAFLLFEAKNTPEETSWSMGGTVIDEKGKTTTKIVEGQRVYGNISEIGKDYIIVDALRFEVTERTKIYDNGAEIRLSDLKEGDRIKLDYTDNFEAYGIYLQRGEE